MTLWQAAVWLWEHKVATAIGLVTLVLTLSLAARALTKLANNRADSALGLSPKPGPTNQIDSDYLQERRVARVIQGQADNLAAQQERVALAYQKLMAQRWLDAPGQGSTMIAPPLY